MKTVESPTYDIQVSKLDILSGVKGDCAFCPIALAVRRVSGSTRISIDGRHATIGHYRYKIPVSSQNWIADFDKGEVEMNEISFQLADGQPTTYWL